MSSKKYKIFHLIQGLGRGGAEVLLSECYQCADRSKFEYGFGYFLPWKDAVVGALRESGAEVICFDSRNTMQLFSSVRRVSRFLRDWRADLLHCHLPLSGVVGRIAGKLSGIPVVYTEHNVQERYNVWTRRINRLTWKFQRKVVAVSHQVADSIRTNIGSGVPVQVVQNGVPVSQFQQDPVARARIRQELGLGPKDIVVGTVAVFRRQKNLQEWLKTASRILQTHPNVHFLLVGDGPLRDELHIIARSLNLSQRIHFPGLQPDVIPYLSAMDIYLISSLFEGLPIALLEAMSMELPVVSTAVGGIPEVIQDGKTGFLVPSSDAEALSHPIRKLLDDEYLRIDFGRAGRNVVQQRFSIQRMTEELEKIYLEVLENAS